MSECLAVAADVLPLQWHKQQQILTVISIPSALCCGLAKKCLLCFEDNCVFLCITSCVNVRWSDSRGRLSSRPGCTTPRPCRPAACSGSPPCSEADLHETPKKFENVHENETICTLRDTNFLEENTDTSDLYQSLFSSVHTLWERKIIAETRGWIISKWK